MQKVVDIKVLTIDEKPYAVDSLSEEIQGLVEMYNDWQRQEVVVRDELTRYIAAKETLSQQIINKVRAELSAEGESSADAEDSPSAD